MDYTTTTVVTTNNSGSWLSGPFMLLWLVLLVASIVGVWKMFEKAGEAGWKSLIPIYNTYTLLRIAGRNGWWLLGLLVPLLNIVVLVMVSLDLAKHFGKSTAFAIFGLLLFPYVGTLILGFGDAKYVGPKHA